MILLDHQSKAADEFLRRDGRMLLWADVGTGKTAIAVECAKRVRSWNILYLAPAILKEQVASEFRAWWPEADVQVIGGTRTSRRRQWALPADVRVMNYETLLTDVEIVRKLVPDFVVVDECQRFAAPSSKTLKAFRKLSPRYRLAMSGTPAPNAIHELWNMCDWVSPGLFHDSFWQFRARECRVHPAFPKILGYYDRERVVSKFMSVVHRIRREDVLSLPPLVEIRIPVALPKPEREVYDALRNELVLRLTDGTTLNVPNVLALLMRLRQLVDCPEAIGIKGPSAKEKALGELLDSISSRKIIVFSELAAAARSLHARYGGLLVEGETPQADRENIFEQFRMDSDRLLFMTSAGTYGVNLQVADTVINYGLPWNDARLEQRVARAWRYGQDKPVTSYRLIAEGTVDEKMERMIEKKRKMTVEELKEFFV